jgi:L-iditol 2-dehydrogenase
VKAAVYHANDDVRIEELPLPVPGPGEILMRIRSSGVCGSDVMEWYRKPKAPLVLGHEIAGTVEKVGPGVEHLRPGERFVVTHHVPCNTCRSCLEGHHSACDTLRSTRLDPGGFAEYARVPALQVDRGMVPIPEDVSFDLASFAEPLACVIHGLDRAGLRPGATVLVVGSGITGLLFVTLAQVLGAARVIATDIVESRLEAARSFGADLAVDAGEDVPARVRAANDGRGADLVVTCTAALSAIRQGFAAAGPGATVLVFAPPEPGVTLPLPMFETWRNDLTMTTAYAGDPRSLLRAMDLIRASRLPLEEMITHRLPLAEAAEAFRLVAEARESIKVILNP